MPPCLLIVVSLIACSLACTTSEDKANNGIHLRVGAPWGLTSFQGTEEAGTSASAIRLVFDPTRDHIRSATQDGLSVVMILEEGSPENAKNLASKFLCEALVSANAVGSDRIVAVFSDELAASKAATLTFGGFALGPFEVRKTYGGVANLVRKRKHHISEIQVMEVAGADEWRLFLGRQLDVIPISSFIHREEFARNSDVKVVDYPPLHAMGLLFNTRGVALRDVAARRRVSSLIDRIALTKVLGGGKPIPHKSAPIGIGDSEALRGTPLILTYLESDLEISRTASVIRFQLAEHDVPVTLAPRDIVGLIAMEGIADMTLLPVPQSHRGYNRFLSKTHPEAGNLTGYANPEFDAAYDAHERQEMDAILSRDVPVTLLYQQQYFAALRGDLCLDEVPDPTSWRWMASIYLCAEG